MTFLQQVARGRDPYAVAERQVGIAGVFLIAYLLFLVPGIRAGAIWPVVVAAALVVAATVAALTVHWPQVPTRWHMLIPLTDLVAAGLLRIDTGAASSPFSALMILAVLSLGIERGRFPVVLAAIGSFVISLVPLLPDLASVTAGVWLRTFFTPLVLACAALTVNELSRRLRRRYERVAQLRAQQEVLLSQAQDHALEAAAASSLLRESAEQLSTVIDSVTEQSIIGTDTVGAVDVYNTGAERMLGRPRHEVMGHLLPELLAGSPLAAAADDGFAELVREIRSGTPQIRDLSLTRADGGGLDVRISATARRDAAGDLEGYLFVLTDMTAEREAARLKDEFTGLISHELRTPLSSILGYLELIADDEENPLSAEQMGYLATVERNAQRLLRLVGDLLFTAQVEAGKFSLDRRPVDLRQIVTSTGESLRPTAAAAGVTLSVFLPDGEIPVDGDPVRLGQACDNLVSNAVKFTKPGGRVAISAGIDDSGDEPVARLSVSDTGVGIPVEEMENLFSRFFRASTATANAVPGVGLGLTITKAIATAHGGTIRVASTPGEGTTFSLALPLRSDAQDRRRLATAS
ncbi:ATP-binding protein [Nakamurella endophytica]|uniref:histidine kinase n=1 Tax=Nakamurella endophytica TaxID=1748367 RepID=A0A917TAZ2_9ACTN|nr:ATP-binding protein [Nakamurella endophytica]GGM17035.1 hypothetical protein GCM10011594_41390 [Nakamurella endophytica]